MKPLLLLLFATTIVACGTDETKNTASTVEKEEKGIGYPSMQAAFDSLKNNPNAKFEIKQGWTIVNLKSGENSEIWSFTPQTHEAHPAAVKRTVFEQDGKVFIKMQASCRASKPACDKLMYEFKQLNDKMKNNLHSAT